MDGGAGIKLDDGRRLFFFDPKHRHQANQHLTICAASAGAAGMLKTGRLGSAQSYGLDDMLLDGVSAVVLGGTSLFGGEGGINNTVMGLLIFGVLNNGLNQLQLDIFVRLRGKGRHSAGGAHHQHLRPQDAQRAGQVEHRRDVAAGLGFSLAGRPADCSCPFLSLAARCRSRRCPSFARLSPRSH